ncbi:MAG: hypothetical protein ACOX0T_00770 [Pelotomaculum sp.]
MSWPWKGVVRPILAQASAKTSRWLLPLILFLLVQLAVLAGLFSRAEMGMYDTWFRLQGV